MNPVYSVERSTADSASGREYSRSTVADAQSAMSEPVGRVQHAVRKLASDSHTGLQIGDRIMMYSKDGKRHRDRFSIDTGSFKTGVKVLIMDVDAGTWEITGENRQERLSVSKDGGYIFFKADYGTYHVTFVAE